MKSEKIFNRTLYLSALSIVVLLLAVFITLLVASVPSIKIFGAGFFIGKTWDATSEHFGALPFLVGTLIYGDHHIYPLLNFHLHLPRRIF